MKGLSLDHPRMPWTVSEGEAVMDDEFGFIQARATAWVKVLNEWFHLRRICELLGSIKIQDMAPGLSY